MPRSAEPPGRAGRALWAILGLTGVGLGFVGAVVPLMPSTVFFILALGCFARSSPRLEAWLLAHPVFGKSLRAWRDRGAIPRRAKVAACCGMTLSFVLILLTVHPRPVVLLSIAAALLLSAAFVTTRPDAT